MRSITTELVEQHLGPGARISPMLRGGFLITTPSGGRIVALQYEFQSVEGGESFRAAAKNLERELYGPRVGGAGEKLGLGIWSAEPKRKQPWIWILGAAGEAPGEEEPASSSDQEPAVELRAKPAKREEGGQDSPMSSARK